MRTTVIPAQITTVEDKIAGNLNLTQIIILLASLFIATFIYAVVPQKMQFSLYKIILIAIEFFICISLSLRIKGKVALNWLFILSSYYFRPSYYIFSKNDVFLRDIEFLVEGNLKKAVKTQRAVAKKAKSKEVTISDLNGLEKILAIHRARLSFKFDKNGGMNAVWQVKS